MNNIKKTMKYSLIIGLIGALLLPIFYEIYANISNAFAMVLILVYVFISAILFSRLDGKSAFLGITVSLMYSGVLGFIAYIIIHPFTEKMLNSNSTYFQLSLDQQIKFVGYVALLLFCTYLICYAKKGIMKAFGTFKSNRDKAGNYINDAFSDEENLK